MFSVYVQTVNVNKIVNFNKKSSYDGSGGPLCKCSSCNIYVEKVSNIKSDVLQANA